MPETDFKVYVEEFHARVSARHVDYFELLGLPKSATFQDIERAYRGLAERFSEENLAALGQSESAVRARALRGHFDHAHEVLTNYSKRQDYENRGFHEAHEKEKIDQPPDMARKIYAKAKILYSQKQYRFCIEAMDKAIKLDSRAEYYQLLGLCQMNISNMRHEAEVSLLKATEIEPWNAEHFFALGILFYNEKLPNRALGYFQKTVCLDAGHLQARKKLEELQGPQFSSLDKLRTGLVQALQKILPSIFRRK
jgi:tetratricopeptide (TPR) repeat protein